MKVYIETDNIFSCYRDKEIKNVKKIYYNPSGFWVIVEGKEINKPSFTNYVTWEHFISKDKDGSIVKFIIEED